MSEPSDSTATLTRLPGNFVKAEHGDRTICRAHLMTDGTWHGWHLGTGARPVFETEQAAVDWVSTTYIAYCIAAMCSGGARENHD